MIRRLALRFLLSVSLPAMALGQGVPVSDSGLNAREMAILTARENDLQTQDARRARQQELYDLDMKIIDQLDELIAAATTPGNTKEIIGDLEAGGSNPDAATDRLYDPNDQNPAAEKVFGDTNTTVEEVIIAGSSATYSHPGVAKAGLSKAQWRALVQALVWQESRFNTHARSPVGAYGLTQIMPATGKDLGIPDITRSTPYQQVEAGSRYLAQQLNAFNGDIVLALAAYNAGAGNVKKHGGVPPFKETQHYVQVIPKKYNEYLAQIGGPDALGTIEPMLAGAGNRAMFSGGQAEYGAEMAMEIAAIATRLKNTIAAMRANGNPSTAWTLNTHARAELARIMALQARMLSVQTKGVSLEVVQEAAAISTEKHYLTFN